MRDVPAGQNFIHQLGLNFIVQDNGFLESLRLAALSWCVFSGGRDLGKLDATLPARGRLIVVLPTAVCACFHWMGFCLTAFFTLGAK